MGEQSAFDRSVFINCPFDEQFAPILQAVAFCVTDLGFRPRLAPENSDNGTSRLERIIELIRESRFGIHDLSRCKSTHVDEYYRLNMPFELGLDHSAARFGAGELASKSILILEESRYDYQKSLSDISGWDIEAHGGEYTQAVRKVSRWLIQHAGANPIGTAAILRHYEDFQEWHWERELSRGASEDDIREYPTIDFVRAMSEWVALDRPL
jgi:hypothetical protein